MVGHSRIVLVREWNALIREPGRWIGKIGGFGDCMVVVVAGSIGPWRPGMGILRIQGWLMQFSAFEARKKVVVNCDTGTFEAL